MPQTCERPGAAPGPIIQNHAGGEISVSPNLPHRTDNRAVLRSLLARVDLAEPVRRRAVQQAVAYALPETHLRRAAMFEAARPRPGDYPGRSTPVELAEADARCAMIAANCRAHARLLAEVEVEEDQ
jgi:hypothetical protein